MLTRIISGVCLAAIVITVIVLQGYVFIAFFTAATLILMNEMLGCLKAKGLKPVDWIVYLYTILQGVGQAIVKTSGGDMMMSLTASFLVLAGTGILFFSYMVFSSRVELDVIQSTLFPMFYPGMFISAIYSLNMLKEPLMVFTAFMLTFFVANMNDAFALIFGLKMGKHKLSPVISPKKTIEGSVAGLIAAVIFTVLIPYVDYWLCGVIPATVQFVQPVPAWQGLALLGLIAGVLSQIGDLAASLVKRYCGIKDFGSVMPGHGGLMDRIDGVLFSAAAFVCYFLLIGA